ncbi:hypothetical protein N792_05405 [Lysobacter concretionis Ko07 = DSM 16239]|uniref:Uncharacterized protein n=2 Tax=Lysobacterales TaxID=135614 RepID=A0A0A0EPY9_9GAMM|nr:hypothetical protein N792_05405 [Lysobacter concretionis Ko07 = DSM 16239]
MYGVAPALLIDCARQIHDWGLGAARCDFDIDDFSKALGAPISESIPVLQAMLADGVFTIAEGVPDRYVASQKLGQLALAKISPGISRAEAENLLAQVVEKASEINARSDSYDHRVTCLVVFGSYLTDKPHLGDLDIGAALDELPGRGDRREGEAIDAWLRRCEAARSRAARALRLRQPKKISVHEWDEVMRLQTPYELVFGALPDR